MSTENLPAAKTPLSPLLDCNAISLSVNTNRPCVLNIKDVQFTTSGLAAIGLALEHAGIKTGDEVLLPAYHCEAMIAPVKWRGAKTAFYEINRDTSIQLDDIEQRISQNTKAIIVTHYFGFEQDLKAIKNLCENRSITLIEDCAHAFFGLSSNQPIGTTGDYAIASCMKFLPIYEGGLIASSKHDLSKLALSPPNMLFQIKSALNNLEVALSYQRLGLAGKLINFGLKLKNRLWTYLKSRRTEQPKPLGPSSSEGGYDIDEEWIHKSMSIFSKLITRFTPLDSIAEKRRANYQALDKSLSTLPGCRPLFATLSEHTVPWVYPLYVENPKKYFTLLKTNGVPLWRFGEFLDPAVDAETYPLSVEYSQHILQFPCHQSLTPQELNWLITTITEIFTNKNNDLETSSH
ncbi:MAG: DegT/DnrJ/EryC1/StrS aminotransferase family protein [Methylomicrobium sp.]|nr:DegT/DnrJ/EryC1/StrS aminotransferase family protein [Methylomicrobium sp.]